MLHFNKLILHNFGPYKGQQIIDFTTESGVTIFWGNNGRGKTTLLNAFRYALFGVIQRRNGQLKYLSEMENEEAKAEGDYGFSVTLKMTNDDDKYELTREFMPRKGVMKPLGDEDYAKEHYLKKNGSILSPSDCEHELNMIMPEQISRFFLFDAELLQEYEELLEEDSQTGDRIKKSVEKILGMPVLQNGVVDINYCLSEYDTKRSRAASRDDKTIQQGKKLEELESNITQHENIIRRLNSELSELIQKRKILEDRMAETEKLRAWLAERKSARQNLEHAERELDDAMSSLRTCMKTAWKGMLATNVRDIREELDEKISVLEKKKQKQAVASEFIVEMKKAIRERVCPVCEQDISRELISVLQAKIDDSNSKFKGLTEEERSELYTLQAQRTGVKSLDAEDMKSTVKVLEKTIENQRIKIGTLQQQIDELDDDIKRTGSSEEESSIEHLTKDYADIKAEILLKREGIEAENKRISEYKNNKEQLSKSITKLAAGTDYKIANARYELCKHLYDIFDESKTRYREHLKEQVEADATSFFVKLSGDKDYVGLQINDNYGLSIVHRSGRLIPGRSSGYEHLVALSLIGALHKNAPLRGPIIMDSPFGRLDPTHKANIVRLLPDMAEQSMLLAYTKEIDEQVAREELKGNLLKEYMLTRVSSLHTEISEGGV